MTDDRRLNDDPGPAAAPHPRRTDSPAPLLIQNASLILTMEPSIGDGVLGALSQTDVVIQNGMIRDIGGDLPCPDGAEVIDATDKIVLPGFVDIHTHLWQSAIRGGAADRSLGGWLDTCARPTLPKIGPADMYRFVRLSSLDTVQTGVTTVVDWVHEIGMDATGEYIRALDDSGLRYVYAALQGDGATGLLPTIKKEIIDRRPHASLMVAAHVSMANLDHAERQWAMAQELGAMLTCHTLEQDFQREGDPIRAFELIGALGPRLLLNHAIHLTDDEVSLVAERDVRAAYCPNSNMRLGSGIMRLPELRAKGTKVGLGLDGGTNDTADFFSLMKSAVGLQRVRAQSCDVYPSISEVLRLATLGGAEAIGMDEEIGSLKVGKRADIILVDPAALNFAPQFDWIGQIVLNGRPSNVDTVIVGGRLLKRHGRLLGVDESHVVREAEAAARRTRSAGR